MDGSQLRALEKACRERLRALESSIDFSGVADVDQLCLLLAAHRGRSIHLEAWELPPDVAGACLASDHADYIFFAADAPPPHQEHIKLHEVGHLLCGHQPPRADVELLRQRFFPRQDPALVRAILARMRYDTQQEREAELVATLIEQRWLGRQNTLWRDPGTGEDGDVAARLDAFAARLRLPQ